MTLSRIERAMQRVLNNLAPHWRTNLEQQQAKRILALIALVREARPFVERAECGPNCTMRTCVCGRWAWLEKAKE